MRYIKSLALAVFLGLSMAPAALASSGSVGAPSDLTVASGRFTNDSTPTFNWVAGEGATWYDVKIDNGSYKGIGNVFYYTSTNLNDGWHTFYLRSHDNRDHISAARSITFEVDTFGPTVGKPTSASVYEDESATFRVRVQSDVDLMSCTLIVKEGKETTDVKMSSRNRHEDDFTADYIFKNDGKYSAYVWCIDGDRNSSVGSTVAVTVNSYRKSGHDQVTTVDVKKGDLIKLRCGSVAYSNDPCHAVYYVGSDEKRHPFLNGEVYATWYNDFDDVEELSAHDIADITLGETVLFKPGSVLVKFNSSPVIYAVGAKSELRPYDTANDVRDDYGSRWESKVQTVRDELISIFKTGTKIDSDGDFDPADIFDEKHDWIDDTFDGR